MSFSIAPYSWPREPPGAVDRLATYVDERGQIFFTGPGSHVVLSSPPQSICSLGTSRLRNIAHAALVASGNGRFA